MTYIRQIYNFLDSIAPFNTAMDFDNCGLLVGDFDIKVDKVLLSLDISLDVIEEARSLGANLIISHHPVIFKPLKKLCSNSVPYILAKYGISAICAHTNLDMAPEGVSVCLAKSLLLKNIKPLSIYKEIPYNKIVVFVPDEYENRVCNAMFSAGAGKLGAYSECSFLSSGIGRFLPENNASPFLGKQGRHESANEMKIEVLCPPEKTKEVVRKVKEAHPYEEPVIDIFNTFSINKELVCGAIGKIDQPMDSEMFASYVKKRLGCKGVRYTNPGKKISTVSVCPGAGGDFLKDAIRMGSDAFVTGEIKHNLILKANECGICVVDAGHFKTEDMAMDHLKSLLSNEYKETEFLKTSTFDDGIKYIGG